MPSHHANDRPAKLTQIFETTYVVSELDRVGAMVVSVVFDGKLDALPPHVKVVPPIAVRAQNRNLGLRPWQAGTNQQEPQSRLLRRLCARVHQIKRLLELA